MLRPMRALPRAAALLALILSAPLSAAEIEGAPKVLPVSPVVPLGTYRDATVLPLEIAAPGLDASLASLPEQQAALLAQAQLPANLIAARLLRPAHLRSSSNPAAPKRGVMAAIGNLIGRMTGANVTQ